MSESQLEFRNKKMHLFYFVKSWSTCKLADSLRMSKDFSSLKRGGYCPADAFYRCSQVSPRAQAWSDTRRQNGPAPSGTGL